MAQETKEQVEPHSQDQPSSSRVDFIEQDEKSGTTRIAGYEAGDLAKAPVASPKPSETEPTEFTSNARVKFLFAVGLLLALVGALLMVTFSLWLGFVVMILGAALVAAGVFAPLK